MLKYCHDKNKTSEMCVKAVDAYLLALKFVSDWFVARWKTSVFSNDDIIFGDLGSDSGSNRIGLGQKDCISVKVVERLLPTCTLLPATKQRLMEVRK